MQDEPDDERSEQVRSALIKGVLALVVVILVIALGTTLMVRALGLDESDSSGPVGSTASEGPDPLPSTALPVPGEESATPEGGGSTPSQPPKKNQQLQLDANPTRAGAMERINLTGTYRGSDNVQLQVQRLEDGRWSDFGVSATVRVGTYETYILTGRVGDNSFRMHDPSTAENSNVVVVRIG